MEQALSIAGVPESSQSSAESPEPMCLGVDWQGPQPLEQGFLCSWTLQSPQSDLQPVFHDLETSMLKLSYPIFSTSLKAVPSWVIL